MFDKKNSPEPNEAPTSASGPLTENPLAAGTQPGVTRVSRGGAATILAEGAKFVGNCNISGTYRVEGTAEGEIEASESLVVGRTGQVHAKVKTPRAVLNGQFEGKIEASDRVELQAGSRVRADIKARNMVMEDGVQFQGNCQIGK
ncbi:MAG: bactofilin family protein [bacterium]